MDPSIIKTLLQPFLAIYKAAKRYSYRLFKERGAAREVFPVTDIRLIEAQLDTSLARLRGEHEQDTWLKSLSLPLEHRLITPEFLRTGEVKDWLADVKVRADLKLLVCNELIGRKNNDVEVVRRLVDAYVKTANKSKPSAVEAINAIVAVLLAGFKASIALESAPLSGLTQEGFKAQSESFQEVNQGLSTLDKKLDRIGPDELVVKAHTEQALANLSRITKRRGFQLDRSCDEIRIVVQRLLSGDLRHSSQHAKSEGLYWAARLHTSDAKHITSVGSYIKQLKDMDSGYDTRIVDALFKSQEGDHESALRLLREVDSPDGRSTLFSVISRTKGSEHAIQWYDSQPSHSDPGFFTGIGWQNLAGALAEKGMWEQATDTLLQAQAHTKDWPDLFFIEGVLNAAMLLPAENRLYALRMNLFHPYISPVRNPDEQKRRSRAYECFRCAVDAMTLIEAPKRAQAARDWMLWLRLTESTPETCEAAKEEVKKAMTDGRQAVDYLPIALRFSIPFDNEPLQRYLNQQKRIGGLEGHEITADMLLAESTMSARQYAEFLEADEASLSLEMPRAFIAGKRVEALLSDGQIAKARHVLDKYKSEFIENDYERLSALILMREGGNARSELEKIYYRTNDLIDLQNLVREVGRSEDWSGLTPLLQELFRRERTPENATRLVDCLHRDPESGNSSVRSFFHHNPDVADWSTDLQSSKAWAHFHVGELREAKTINDKLLTRRDDALDLQLDMNLAIQAGDWERFSAIVERAWDRRHTYAADVLLRLASLAAEVDTVGNRAFELAKLAAKKASDSASVLLNAYSLAVQLGRDHEADPTWITRAAELSTENGPVRKINMRTLVQEMMPASRERDRLVESHLLKGEIPLHIAAEFLHIPLCKMLIDIPRRNTEQTDGRRRVIIPILSEARPYVPLVLNCTIGLDVTALLVLGYLNLLPAVLKAFHRIVLSPDVMVVLLDERRRVRFHQPSRVKSAEEILSLIERKLLKEADTIAEPPAWLVQEVGRDLADMLEIARNRNGRVVRPRPISKPATFLIEEANLREYNDLILSTTALARILYASGKLDQHTYDKGISYLAIHDRSVDIEDGLSRSVLAGPIFLDDLAVTYLQQADLLQSVCRSSPDVWGHPSLKDEQNSLIAASREGARLNNDIESIRRSLREAFDDGKISFLPRHYNEKDKFTSLGGFFADSGDTDYICIDDRFINRHQLMTDKKGRAIPVVGTPDIVKVLETQGLMDTGLRQSVLHKMRAGGFAFVPLELDDLWRMVRNSSFDDSAVMIETLELKILRQSLMRIRALDMFPGAADNVYLLKLRSICLLTIHRLWQDSSLPIQHARSCTDWLWKNISPSPLDWDSGPSSPTRTRSREVAFTNHLAALLSPMGQVNGDRYNAFLQWAEEEVIQPLLISNPTIVPTLASEIKSGINKLVQKLTNESR